jgi:hypothetical protein
MENNSGGNDSDTEEHKIVRDIAGVVYNLASGRQSITTNSSGTKRLAVNLAAFTVLEVGQTLSLVIGNANQVITCKATVTVQAVA